MTLDVERTLDLWLAHRRPPVLARGTSAVVRAFQEEAGLEPDGVVGPQTRAALDAVVQAVSPRLRPALPTVVSFPADAYPPAAGWLGLQPWIAPQVRALCDRFGLRVSAGWGGHPPHAVRSDHRWGGGCDLTGERRAVVACNLWADGLRADPWREGAVFRWVGGPAADAGGPEPDHLDHVHLSWFRAGPATTVFGAPGFP